MKKWKELNQPHLLWLIAYVAVYLLGFFVIDHMEFQNVHLIHSAWDDRIPFCEYFVVFYLFWFVYVLGTFLIFGLDARRRSGYWKLAASFMIGMTLFLVVSVLYPNQQNLRPVLEGNGICIQLVRFLYWVDSPTSILPSMHVYCSVICFLAYASEADLREKKWVVPLAGTLAFLIIISTLFIKQHTVVDIFAALIWNLICYLLVYQIPWKKIRNTRS